MIDRLLARGRLAGDEEDYLDVLSDLVEKYEDQHYPIEPVSGLDALRHLVESSGKTRATVAAEAGLPESTLSEVLLGRAGSIPGTSASWPATSVSIRAFPQRASRVGCVALAPTRTGGGADRLAVWTASAGAPHSVRQEVGVNSRLEHHHRGSADDGAWPEPRKQG